MYLRAQDRSRCREQLGSSFRGLGHRKLIEYALLTLATPVLPITGKDIIEVLDVAPGPEIGRLLDRAHGLYRESPCSRETLLERLIEELD